MKILAIDPGTTESAFVEWDGKKIGRIAKTKNEDITDLLSHTHRSIISGGEYIKITIEMVASYGMPVGREVFETCVWIGRFMESTGNPGGVELIYRKDVKLNICNSPRANDTTIKKALIDRFAYGVGNHGKGYKKDPGFFYGFKKDIWQAFALAVTCHDVILKCP